MAAAGSLWNKNSWHWEEKNKSEIAREILDARIKEISLSLADQSVQVSDLKASGECAISVRKGKKIVCWEFNLKIEFKCGSSTCFAKIQEVSQDDIEDCSINVASKDAKLKDLIRKEGTKEIRAALRDFHARVSELEGQADALAADQQRRADELKRTADAAAATNEEKAKIAAAAKEKEAARKQAEAEKAAAMKVPAKDQPAGTGSVWNTNSYHWEEKPMHEWGYTHISKLLTGSFNVNGVEVALTTEASGEATHTIRKGKKIIVWELKVIGDWCTSAARGTFQIPEFNSEDGPESKMTISKTDGDVPAGLNELIKEKLALFAEDFKAQ